MKILITGANGYVGSSLFRFLKGLYHVTSITRKDFDLTDTNIVKQYFSNRYFDVVIHCAIFGGGRLKKDDTTALDINLLMYYNLLQNRSCYGKFISFGSGAEIYAKDDYYGMSKNIIRTSMFEKDNFYNIRIYGLFDENELNSRFIKANILRYLNRESIQIYENKTMDIFYMKDFFTLVNYYITHKNPPKEIDCTYEKTYTLLEIANMINELDTYKVPINIHTRTNHYCGTFTNLGLNYVGLQKGIIQTYQKLIP